MTNSEITSVLQSGIYLIRHKQVMLDSSISACFQVPVKRINEQVKRNKVKFPVEFCFQLNPDEWKLLKSQIATSNLSRGGKIKPPGLLLNTELP